METVGPLAETRLGALFSGALNDDPTIRGQLFAALYEELRRMAEQQLRRDGGQATLSPTTLLHETYLALAERESVSFPDRKRFMGYACRAMRGLIVDYIRSRRAQRRGGQYEITSLPTQIPESSSSDDELLRLNDAVDELAHVDPELAELVELKFFCGYSLAELAQLRGVTERTLHRHWDRARIFLFEEMNLDSLSR